MSRLDAQREQVMFNKNSSVAGRFILNLINNTATAA